MIRVVYPDELMHSSYIAIDSSNSLWHYGRPGMKWYHHIYGDHLENSTARAQRRIAKRGAKIQRIKAKGLDASRAYKLKAKQSKYQDKLYKLEAKNRRTKVRLMKGKKIGFIRRHNLLQEERMKSNKAKVDLKLNKPETKIKDLEYNNRRDEERIVKNNKRLGKLDNRVDKSFNREYSRLEKAFNNADERANEAYKQYGANSDEHKRLRAKSDKIREKRTTMFKERQDFYRNGVYDKSSKRKKRK